MTKTEVLTKYTEAALADPGMKAGEFCRCDNFRDIAFKLRQACFDGADFVEVGHGLIEATFKVKRNGEEVTRKQVFYVQ